MMASYSDYQGLKFEFKPGCTGKVPFFSLKEAWTYSRTLNRIKSHHSVYHCKFLFNGQEHYHITSMPRGTYKRMVKKLKK